MGLCGDTTLLGGSNNTESQGETTPAEGTDRMALQDYGDNEAVRSRG